MRTRLVLALAAGALVTAPAADAAEIFRKVGTAGAQFLKIGVGARAVGIQAALFRGQEALEADLRAADVEW